MKLETAETLALKLMRKHGLLAKGWTFKFDNAQSRLGNTNFTRMHISISKYMTGAATAAFVEQVILHEIAHALLPVEAKHGHHWKSFAASLGYTGARTMPNPYKPKPTTARKPQRRSTAHLRIKPLTTPDLPNGTVLALPNGHEVKIFKAARTRYHAKTAEGQVWTVSFRYAKTLVKV